MSRDMKHFQNFLKSIEYTTTYTIWNEIDERIYEGTPDFETREEAYKWWEKNDGRPSSIIIERVTFNTNKP